MSLVPNDPYAPNDGGDADARASSQGNASPPPGWYPDPTGQQRYWDGRAWGHYAPPAANAPVVYQQTFVTAPVKETTIAYLFAIFLGGFGAHNFYLGRQTIAIWQVCLYAGGILTSWLGVGVFLIIGVGIWVIVELFMIPEFVREANARILGQNAGYAAPGAAGYGAPGYGPGAPGAPSSSSYPQQPYK